MFCKIVNPVNPVDSVKIAGLQLCVQFAWSPGPDSPSLWAPALSLGQPSCVTPEPGRRCYEPAKHLRVQNGVTCCPPPPPPGPRMRNRKPLGAGGFRHSSHPTGNAQPHREWAAWWMSGSQYSSIGCGCSLYHEFALKISLLCDPVHLDRSYRLYILT